MLNGCNFSADIVNVRLFGNYMDVVRFHVKTAMLFFQHSGYRRRQITMHTHGKPCFYDLQICGYQNPDASVRQQRQVFPFRNNIDNILTVDGFTQLCPERLQCGRFILFQAKIISAGINLSVYVFF